ncbi:hypothetical protein P171DRAFT_423329 [Karstenula rhodostoma CBS 690.94]|uniref:Uncharacterized protein n=1 Tax=Karstenula rhodostoma CBS 690.94 TaxID=1392251 RepID=A0A9P4P7L7_9PLEO|nr:hypothetical protein P171DRAFT_423329 [Karstenula rhodostoma CBS 690.94]
MARTIYLAVFSNGSKPAHWAIWLPSPKNHEVGKLVHVTGNPATGFYLEFKRNYDFSTTYRGYRILALAQVNDQFVKDTTELEGKDTTARDRLESTATVVPPPGRSANPFDPAAPNCQNWIFDFVEKLIADGSITGDSRTVLQNAPKRL